MTPEIEFVHHRPGRLRVRSDALFADAEDSPLRVARIREAITTVHGIRSVAYNGRSGSVLVEYVPGDVEPDAVVDAIGRAAGLPIARQPEDDRARRPSLAERILAFGREIDARTAALTGGRADLRTLVPGAMLGMAAFSFVVKKERLPRWDNLAFWAFTIFNNLHGGAERRPTHDGSADGAV